MRFLNCQFRIPYTLGLAKDFSCGEKKKRKKKDGQKKILKRKKEGKVNENERKGKDLLC